MFLLANTSLCFFERVVIFLSMMRINLNRHGIFINNMFFLLQIETLSLNRIFILSCVFICITWLKLLGILSESIVGYRYVLLIFLVEQRRFFTRVWGPRCYLSIYNIGFATLFKTILLLLEAYSFIIFHFWCSSQRNLYYFWNKNFDIRGVLLR